MITKSLLSKCLTIGLIVLSWNAEGQGDCKKSKITFEAIDAVGTTETGLVKLDFKGQPNDRFVLSLIGPRRYINHDFKEHELKSLSRGSHILIIGGRNEADNFCQEYFQFIIK